MTKLDLLFETKNVCQYNLRKRVIIKTLLPQNNFPSYLAIKFNRKISSITTEIIKWIKYPSDQYEEEIIHNATYKKKRELYMYCMEGMWN